MFGRLSGEKAALRVEGFLVKFDTLLFEVPRGFLSMLVALILLWPTILKFCGEIIEV